MIGGGLVSFMRLCCRPYLSSGMYVYNPPFGKGRHSVRFISTKGEIYVSRSQSGEVAESDIGQGDGCLLWPALVVGDLFKLSFARSLTDSLQGASIMYRPLLSHFAGDVHPQRSWRLLPLAGVVLLPLLLTLLPFCLLCRRQLLPCRPHPPLC